MTVLRAVPLLFLVMSPPLCADDTGVAEVQKAAAAEATVEATVLDIAYSASLFYNVDVNDALAATGVWVKSILREKTGDEIGLRAFVFQDSWQLIQAYRAGKVDLIVTNPLEYLAVVDSVEIRPVLVGASDTGPLDEFILLVHESSRIDRLEMLSGKELIIEVAAKGELPSMWLDILLMMNHLPPALEHARIRRVTRTSQALLPVFFQQSDACVVTRRAFELMVELNPQLGTVLIELYSSPGYSRSLLCLRPDLYDAQSQLLQETLMALHKQARGQQILRLFHLERLIPFEPYHLNAVESLLTTYNDLRREREE